MDNAEPVTFGENYSRIKDLLALALSPRDSTVQVAVEIASREMLLASPKVLVEAVERALL